MGLPKRLISERFAPHHDRYLRINHILSHETAALAPRVALRSVTSGVVNARPDGIARKSIRRGRQGTE